MLMTCLLLQMDCDKLVVSGQREVLDSLATEVKATLYEVTGHGAVEGRLRKVLHLTDVAKAKAEIF